MVRNYTKKTARTTNIPPGIIQRALGHYNTHDGTRSTASMFNVPRSTLRGYIKKLKTMSADTDSISKIKIGYSKHRQIFSDNDEMKMADYIKGAAEIYFGLSPRDVRSLAYQCAVHTGVTVPPPWSERNDRCRVVHGIYEKTPVTVHTDARSDKHRASYSIQQRKCGHVLQKTCYSYGSSSI
ncbi:hypothetical protein SNE40_022287 [Patella caerulea]|uniref:HTH psq-type domain-containing protein n=1 Tax=Patella caerulea TaxID=87958 RepID=A0AAN8GAM4_PATCE